MNRVIFIIYFALLNGIINASLKPRIIGGEDANIKDFPYQASIHLKNKYVCGGCIISERHILTAAHCVHNVKSPYLDLTVSTGTSRSTNSRNSYDVIRVILHPAWSANSRSSFDYDIAVIKLNHDIRFDEKQQKLDIPKQNVVSNTKAMLTGWGRTSAAKGPKFSDKLQKLEMTVLDYTNCQPQHSYVIFKTQLCAYDSVGHGPCHGDSGSPLVVENQVIGIASWLAELDCATGKPDVYTNVYTFRNFIETSMKK